MATIARNPANDALIQTSQNLLNIMLRNREMQMQREFEENRQIEFQQQLEEEQRQFGVRQDAERTARMFDFAMDRIRTAPPGSTIEQLGLTPEVMEMSGLSGTITPGTILTPETVDSLTQKLAVKKIESQGIDEDTIERAINVQIIGRPVSNTELAMEDLASETRFSVLTEKIGSLDPRQRQQIFESTIGLPESVEFQFGGQTFRFESAQAASTAVAFMNLEAERMRGNNTQRDVMLQHREALKERMEQSGVESFQLGNARARAESERIISGYYDDPAKIEAITNPNVKAFVSAQLSARDLSDASLMERFMQTEEGQALMFTTQLGEMSGLPEDEVSKFLIPLTERIAESTGLPVARLRQRGILNDRFEINFENLPSAQRLEVPGNSRAAEQVQTLSGQGRPQSTVDIPDDLADDPMAVDAIRQGATPEQVRIARSALRGASALPAASNSARSRSNAALIERKRADRTQAEQELRAITGSDATATARRRVLVARIDGLNYDIAQLERR